MSTFMMRRIEENAQPATSREQGIARLLEFGLELYGVPSAFFDYRLWFNRLPKTPFTFSCGTTACAGGHAMLAFGLELVSLSADVGARIAMNVSVGARFMRLSDGRTILAPPDRQWVAERDGTIKIRRALELLFALEDSEVSFLFVPGYRLDWGPLAGRHAPGDDATQQQVADHILRFVAAVVAHEKLELPKRLVVRAKELAPDAVHKLPAPQLQLST